MEYTVFVIDGGYLNDGNDTIAIQGVIESEILGLIRLFTTGENNFDLVIRSSVKE